MRCKIHLVIPRTSDEDVRKPSTSTLNVNPPPQNLGAPRRLSTTQYESTVALLARDRKIRSHRTEDYV
jgi:hypothetical protein